MRQKKPTVGIKRKDKTMTEIDADKMREFVDEGVRWHGARIVGERRLKTRLVFRIEGCDLARLEDFVNQRLGHYAYEWFTWLTDRGELAIG